MFFGFAEALCGFKPNLIVYRLGDVSLVSRRRTREQIVRAVVEINKAVCNEAIEARYSERFVCEGTLARRQYRFTDQREALTSREGRVGRQ